MSRFAATLRLTLLLALVGVFGFSSAVPGREPPPTAPLASIALTDLPAEARHIMSLIQSGGPFPYPGKDGSTFGNFERSLPQQPRAYYREYTVPTPGRPDRGARRIIAGSGHGGDVATSGEYYYTGDHYRSFRRIRQP